MRKEYTGTERYQTHDHWWAAMKKEEEMAGVGNSRFAITCSHMGIIRRFGEPVTDQIKTTDEDDGRTMQLFPMPSNESKSSRDKEREKTLTISYQGQAVDFESFPVYKVMELVFFAASMVSSPVGENKVRTSSEMAITTEQSTEPNQPIARKVSLQRFLQKGKHRVSSAEPYHKGLISQSPLEKDVIGAGNKLKYDPATTNWLTL